MVILDRTITFKDLSEYTDDELINDIDKLIKYLDILKTEQSYRLAEKNKDKDKYINHYYKCESNNEFLIIKVIGYDKEFDCYECKGILKEYYDKEHFDVNFKQHCYNETFLLNDFEEVTKEEYIKFYGEALSAINDRYSEEGEINE